MIKVRIDGARTHRLEQMVKGFDKSYKKARETALDSAVEVLKNEITDEVTKNYFIGSDVVRKTIKTASRGSQAWVKSKGPRIPAVSFKISPGRVIRGYTPKYYLLGTKRSKGMEPLNKSHNKKPFLQKKKSNGKLGLYIREGEKRYPLRTFYSKSVPQMIADEDVLNVIQRKAETELYYVLEEEVKKILEGRGSI